MRKVARYGRVLGRWGLLTVGSIIFIGGPLVWLATPWPTEAARYMWRQWDMPSLAVALDRTDAPLAMEIGNASFGSTASIKSGAYDPALAARAFRRAVAIDPGVPWGHYQLARIAFVRSDFDRALGEINAELAANPENLRSLYVRGLIYGYRNLPGDPTLAEADFTQFTEWAPSEWAGYNDLAWVLAKEEKYQEIEQVMARALQNVSGAPENPWLWNMLGVARLNLGEEAGACAAFTKALAYAEKLTLADWRAAYSGDSPASDQEGLAAFIAGIRDNLKKAGG